MTAPPAVAIIDIDGVVADVRHRLHHLDASRWDRFFAAAADDPVLDVGATLARELAVSHPIVWLSGRPESLRAVTEAWLRRHDLPPGRLVLRPDGDYRPAAVLKLALVRRLTAGRLGVDGPGVDGPGVDGLAAGGNVAVAAMVDDDPEVVRVLRAAGFPVVLADWVPNDRVLRRAQQRLGRT